MTANAIEALHQGDVSGALNLVKSDVRAAPQDAKHRVFLFQLFTIVGDWNRALSQLKVAAELDKQCELMRDTYQHILQCEALRADVFEGRRAPLVFGEPAAWIAKLIEALRMSASGEYESAKTLQVQAFEEAEPSSGSLLLRSKNSADTGQSGPFEWIADADSRLGPILEVILQGKYYWVPLNRIEKIHFEDVVDLRDFVWIAAQFTWIGGGEMVGMVPVRYPGSQASSDELIQLARKTEWQQAADEMYLGLGQRMLATDRDDFAMLDISTLTFNSPS